MSDPQIEITAVCDVHQGSGRLIVRRKDDRVVLDGHADDCCVISLSDPAAALLFDVLGELVGQRGEVVADVCDVRLPTSGVESVAGLTPAAQGTSLPVRVPGAHLHPGLRRPTSCVGPDLRAGGEA